MNRGSNELNVKTKVLPDNFCEIMMQTSADGIVITNMSQDIIKVNSAFCKISGFSESELIDTSLRDWIKKLGDKAANLWAELEQSIHQQRFCRDTVLQGVKGEEIVYFSINARILEDLSSAEAGVIVSTWRDITARMLAEEEIKEMNLRLTLATESAGFGIWDLDLKKNVLVWDERMHRIYGTDPENFDGSYENWQNLVHPEDVERVLREVESAMSGSLKFKSEFRIIRPDGEIRHIKAHSIIVLDDNGNPIRRTGVNHDVTERKRALEALAHSQENYRDLVENANEVIFTLDEHQHFTYVSSHIEELTGYSPSEIVGKGFKELIFEEDAPLFVDQFAKTSSSQSVSGEYRLLTASNELKWARISTRLILRNNREIIIRGSMIDLTESKYLQAKLFQADKMASIGQLAAGVAHEINNPIGFINSNLTTLRKYINRIIEYMDKQMEVIESFEKAEIIESLSEMRGKLKLDYITDDLEELLSESIDGTDRVKRIVQDLKTFSRVDEVENKFADINECIESTLNLIWNELKYKTNLKKELGDIPQVKCFPKQLSQVFMNLLINASQAINDQGEITIKTSREDGFVKVRISDTGCGIPKEKLEKVFEPFYTTKEVGEGTGLGLSISYDIVQKHNGNIYVQSEVGKGTEFTVALPITEEEEHDEVAK